MCGERKLDGQERRLVQRFGVPATYYTSRDECGSRHTEHTVYHGNARTMCLMATKERNDAPCWNQTLVALIHVRSDGAQGAPVTCEATAA